MRQRAGMAFLHVALALLAAAWAVEADGGGRARDFSGEEIKRMTETMAVIETRLGRIELRFFPDAAPNHVNNFVELAKKGFYDGTVFHRVVPGFVIQGGDPQSRSHERAGHGTGGPGHTVKAEFGSTPHKRGTLSMARGANPHSAGSQFFICVADLSNLDGQYTVFGEVTGGMDVVDMIVGLPRDGRDNPIERVEIKVRIIEPENSSPKKGGKT